MLNDPQTPAHYAGAVTPWDLQKCMKSSGNAFVDARRTDVIEYAFRMKGDLLGDLKKARHCLDVAIDELEKQVGSEGIVREPTQQCVTCLGLRPLSAFPTNSKTCHCCPALIHTEPR
jgi:hypothetical protein